MTCSPEVRPRIARKFSVIEHAELGQHVHVAVGTKVVPEHRAEQGQLRDAPAFAERGDRFGGYFDACGHGGNARFMSISKPTAIDPAEFLILPPGRPEGHVRPHDSHTASIQRAPGL